MVKTLLDRFIAAAVYFHPDAATGTASGSDGAAGTGPGATAPLAGGGDAAGAAAAAAAAAEKVFTFKEDRTHWVDPDRFRKAEGLVNRTTKELEGARALIAEQNRRIAALAGVQTPSADEVETQRIADAFFALPQFAHLKHLTPELLEQVRTLASESTSIQAARDHVWNSHTDRFLARLDERFADEIGVESLTPGQQRKLRAAFGALIPDERTDPEAHAAFTKRFEAGDEKLIDDFVAEFRADMLEPARRQATVTTTRRPVPRSGPAAPVVSQRVKPDYSQMTVSQMLEHAEKEAEAVGR
jgi:hypothetical protein